MPYFENVTTYHRFEHQYHVTAFHTALPHRIATPHRHTASPHRIATPHCHTALPHRIATPHCRTHVGLGRCDAGFCKSNLVLEVSMWARVCRGLPFVCVYVGRGVGVRNPPEILCSVAPRNDDCFGVTGCWSCRIEAVLHTVTTASSLKKKRNTCKLPSSPVQVEFNS